MGPFNVLTRSSFIYLKLYLKDEFENVYIHEDLGASTLEPIWAKLTNATAD